jgi:cysteine desulfurase
MTEFYLDANAGLPLRAEAAAEWQRVATHAAGNPASLHRAGRRAQGELERARESLATRLHCASRELVFTSGATEACNLALLGMIRGRASLTGKKQNLLASHAEHPAVLGPLRVLQQEGHRLHLLPIDSYGRVKRDALAAALLEQDWDLLALQWANNETGAVQPIAVAAEQLPSDTLWFCDSVQGFGKLPYDPALQRADSFVLSGHKFQAPHGTGAWVLREHVFFEAPMTGGGHQGGRRPGTESPELAAALAIALSLACREQPDQERAWLQFGEHLQQAVLEAFPDTVVHHPAEGPRLANTYNFGFPGLDGRMLLPALDAEGLAVSAGSACSSGSPEPSAVLLAAGVSETLARASLRISFPPSWEAAQAELATTALLQTIRRVYEVANR